MTCDQCGKNDTEPWRVFWAMDMGNLCRACFDEIVACPPRKREKEGEEAKPRITPEERKAKSQQALVKAREVRSARAKEKADRLAEDRARRRAENPEAYDAMIARKRAALVKAREARSQRKKEKELTPA
jgi:hypothetical protein